jgi:hypothetical protein
MNRIQHTLLTALGILALAAAGTSAGLTQHNAGLRLDIAGQQQYVQQSVQLETLYREMVRALAELAASRRDDELRTLLQRHGITYSAAPAASAPAAPSPGPGRK